MSRLHDMKVGKIKAVKKEYKEKRNDKESILTRLSHYLFKKKTGLPEVKP